MLQGLCDETIPALFPKARDASLRPLDLSFGSPEAARRLARLGGLVWLDSAVAEPGARSILTAAPIEILRGSVHDPDDWNRVRRRLNRAKQDGRTSGGLFGWVGYEGEFVLGVYPHTLVLDHDSGQWYGDGGFASALEEASAPGAFPSIDFQPRVRRSAFLKSIERAQAYIAAGDIYQVNLAYPWEAVWPVDADALPLYERLRAVSPAPQAAFVDLAGTRVLSASPETFLKIDGSSVVTRPIKGTRPRFLQDPERDAAARAELLASEKERAELLMITDLERNDLGRVCEFGSVEVPELWEVQSFAQVHHFVSTVHGRLREGIDHAQAFRACFPGGSITGAPKKRATEIIAELEPYPRGIYTGAIGYFGFDGSSQWNIAIRTAVQKAERIRFLVGAGIVADSIPEHEHEETLHKAAGLLASATKPSL